MGCMDDLSTPACHHPQLFPVTSITSTKSLPDNNNFHKQRTQIKNILDRFSEPHLKLFSEWKNITSPSTEIANEWRLVYNSGEAHFQGATIFFEKHTWLNNNSRKSNPMNKI